MRSTAKTIVTARVAKIEYREVGNGLWSMSLPDSQSWKNKDTGEWDEKTFWYNCSCWGDFLAKRCANIGKGDIVTVEGRMESRENDGKTYTNLNVDSITVVVKADQMVKREKPVSATDDDDLPF